MNRLLLCLISVGVLGFLSSCEPASSGDVPAKTDSAPSVAEPAATETPEPSFLDPVLGRPWLGHSEGGNLVKVEFFVNKRTAETLCRVNVTGSVGALRPQQSSFSATADLSMILWDEGKSRGSFSKNENVLEVTVTTNAGIERARLRQISVKENPELASYRRFVPDDAPAKSASKAFVERLARGTRWWKSGVPWEKVTTPPTLEASAKEIALIWPTQAKPISLPAVGVGGDVRLPITCHLPPGTRLSDEQTTVGIFTELQSKQNQSSTWIFHTLHPGASVQEVTANWKLLEGDLPPSGECVLLIYLAKVVDVGAGPKIDINKPISNLVSVDLTIAE